MRASWVQVGVMVVSLVVTAVVSVGEVKATGRIVGFQVGLLAEQVERLVECMDRSESRHYELRERVTRLEGR